LSKPYYVKFETPTELIDASLEALRQARQTGKIRKGTNEATKAVERGIAKLVIMAEDVEPPEVVAHIPIICDEMNTPYIFVPNKQQIGDSIGIDVGAAAACVIESGDAEGILEQIIESISKIKKN
jgi:large subunit ribosomal protein L7Ae